MNTYIESKPLRLAGNGSELIFWSERDGWGHFYLYDAATGALKNRITEGEFVTTSLEGIDEKTRVVYLTAAGREKGEDPYYTHLYSVGLDGTGMKLLAPGDASQSAIVSESNRYFVTNSSRVDTAPESILYDTLGNVVTKLETPDLTRAQGHGLQVPRALHREGRRRRDRPLRQDVQAVRLRSERRSTRSSLYVYPGPQTERVTKTFTPRNGNIALAQCRLHRDRGGQSRRHPTRSKWYHNYGYGNLRDYGLAGQEGGDRAAGAAPRLHRHRPRRHLRALRRRLHVGRGDARLSRLLQGRRSRSPATTTTTSTTNTWSEKNDGVKEVEKDGKVTFEFDIEKNSGAREEPQGPPDARARRTSTTTSIRPTRTGSPTRSLTPTSASTCSSCPARATRSATHRAT